MSRKIDIQLGFTADITQAKTQMSQLQQQLTNITSTKSKVELDTAGLNKANTDLNVFKTLLDRAFDPKSGKLNLSQLSAEAKNFGLSIKDISNGLKQIDPVAFTQLNIQLSRGSNEAFKLTGLLGKMADQLARTAKIQLSYSILNALTGTFSDAYNYAKDLNESLTNIQIVTQKSTNEMSKFAVEANKAAKALSTDTLSYTDASLIYYQQGLTDKQVQERTDTTIKLANVTGQTAEEVSSQMTAIWNNFDNGSKELEYYADVITKLGAATASSSSEIAQGLAQFSAVAKTVGLSYEYATGALATVVAQTRQSADTVGNSFKTIFARLESLNLGETLDDDTTLTKYTTALEKVGVQVQLQDGQLKKMDNILDELGTKWANLTQQQKNGLAYTVAGARQYTNFIALMDNWDKAQKNIDIAGGAEGTLQEQQEIYADSWKAASQELKAATEELYDLLINDKAFIIFTNALTKVVEGISNLIKGFGGLIGFLPMLISLSTQVFSRQMVDGIRSFLEFKKELTGKGGETLRDEAFAASGEQNYTKIRGNITAKYKDARNGLAYLRNTALRKADNAVSSDEEEVWRKKALEYSQSLDTLEKAQNDYIEVLNKNKDFSKHFNAERDLQSELGAIDRNNRDGDYEETDKALRKAQNKTDKDLVDMGYLSPKEAQSLADQRQRKDNLMKISEKLADQQQKELYLETELRKAKEQDLEHAKAIVEGEGYKDSFRKLEKELDESILKEKQKQENILKEVVDKEYEFMDDPDDENDYKNELINTSTQKGGWGNGNENLRKAYLKAIEAQQKNQSSLDNLHDAEIEIKKADSTEKVLELMEGVNIKTGRYKSDAKEIGALENKLNKTKEKTLEIQKEYNNAQKEIADNEKQNVKIEEKRQESMNAATQAIDDQEKHVSALTRKIADGYKLAFEEMKKAEPRDILSEQAAAINNTIRGYSDILSLVSSVNNTINSIKEGTMSFGQVLGSIIAISTAAIRVANGELVKQLVLKTTGLTIDKETGTLKAAEAASEGIITKNKIIQLATGKSLLTVTLAITAALAVVVGIVTLIAKTIKNNSPEEKLKRLTEKTNKASEAVTKWTSSYDSLKDAQKNIASLTKGTLEYAEAAKKASDQAKELLNNADIELSDAIKNNWAEYQNGVLTITNSDAIYKKLIVDEIEANLIKTNTSNEEAFNTDDFSDTLQEAIVEQIKDANNELEDSLLWKARDEIYDIIKIDLENKSIDLNNQQFNEDWQYAYGIDANKIYNNIVKEILDNILNYGDYGLQGSEALRYYEVEHPNEVSEWNPNQSDLATKYFAQAALQGEDLLNKETRDRLISQLKFDDEWSKEWKEAITTGRDDVDTLFSKASKETQEYGKLLEDYLKETKSYLKDFDELTHELAINTQETIDGLTDLITNSEQYFKLLNSGTSGQKAEAKNKITEDLGLIYGQEDTSLFTEEWIKNHQKNIEAVINHDKKAYLELGNEIAKTQLIQANISEEIATTITNDLNDITKTILEENLQTGDTLFTYLDDKQRNALLLSINRMLSAGMTYAQIADALDNKDIEISTDFLVNFYDSDGNLLDLTSDDAMKALIDKVIASPESLTTQTNFDTVYDQAKEKSGKSSKSSKKEADRYYTISRQVSELNNQLEKLSKVTDRAFGKDKLAGMQAEIDKYNELIAANKAYLSEAENWLDYDRQKLEAYGAAFDENGIITNYEEMFAAHGNDEDGEWAKWLSHYEDSLAKVQELQDAIEEQQRAIYDKMLEGIQYKVEFIVEIDDTQLKYFEFLLGNLEDEAFDTAESFAVMGRQMDTYQRNYDAYHKELIDILNLASNGDGESVLNRILGGEDLETIVDELNLTADAQKELFNAFGGLIDQTELLKETWKSYLDLMEKFWEAWDAKFQEQINKIEHLSKVTDAYKKLVDILGKDRLGVSDATIQRLNHTLTTAAQDRYNTSRAEYEAANSLYQQALANGWDKSADKGLQELVKKYKQATDEAYEKVLDDMNSLAEAAKTEAEDAINMIVDSWEDAVAGMEKNLSKLSEAMERAKTLNELYLDTYEQAYNMNKLSRDIAKSINDTAIVKNKQELAGLLEHINELQANGAKLSQYEYEAYQKEYELLLAKAALEDARDAKSQVRMTRDNEGNMSYVYTADQDAIDAAQSNYDDVAYQFAQLNNGQLNEAQQQLLQLDQWYAEQMRNSLDMSEEEIERIKAYYDESRVYWEEQMNTAYGWNKALMDQTGLDYWDLATDFNQSVLSRITGIESLEEYEKNHQEFVNTMLGEIKDTTEEFKNDIVDITVIGEEKINQELDLVDKGLEETQDATEELSDTFQDEMMDMTDAAEDFRQKYWDVVESSIEETTRLGEAIVGLGNTFLEQMENIQLATAALEEYTYAAREAAAYGGVDYTPDKTHDNNNNGDKYNYWIGSRGFETKTDAYNAAFSAGVTFPGDYITTSKGSQLYIYNGHMYTYDSLVSSLGNDAIARDMAKKAKRFGTGGYTGEWGPEGRLALLDQKELVLNASDTDNMFKIIDAVREISTAMQLQSYGANVDLSNTASSLMSGFMSFDQNVHITAEFPNATDRNEIQAAFGDLLNRASQYVNRKN